MACENGMKTRTFTGSEPGAVIKAVNDWLGATTGVSIKDTETRELTDPQTGAVRIEFDVRYEQSAP